MITSSNCCRCVGCTSIMQISCSTTSQRYSTGLRSSDCGGLLSTVKWFELWDRVRYPVGGSQLTVAHFLFLADKSWTLCCLFASAHLLRSSAFCVQSCFSTYLSCNAWLLCRSISSNQSYHSPLWPLPSTRHFSQRTATHWIFFINLILFLVNPWDGCAWKVSSPCKHA